MTYDRTVKKGGRIRVRGIWFSSPSIAHLARAWVQCTLASFGNGEILEVSHSDGRGGRDTFLAYPEIRPTRTEAVARGRRRRA